MKLKNLIGICCIFFCILIYFSISKEETIIIRDYEWNENMDIVKEYREIQKEKFETLYNEMRDTIKVELVKM